MMGERKRLGSCETGGWICLTCSRIQVAEGFSD